MYNVEPATALYMSARTRVELELEVKDDARQSSCHAFPLLYPRVTSCPNAPFIRALVEENEKALWERVSQLSPGSESGHVCDLGPSTCPPGDQLHGFPSGTQKL